MFFRDALTLISGYLILLSIMLAGKAYLWQAFLFGGVYTAFVLMVVIGEQVPPLLKEDRQGWDEKRGKAPNSNELSGDDSPGGSIYDNDGEGVSGEETTDLRRSMREGISSSPKERDAHDYFLPRIGEIHMRDSHLHISTTRTLRRQFKQVNAPSQKPSGTGNRKNMPLAHNWKTTSMSSLRTNSGLDSGLVSGSRKMKAGRWGRYLLLRRIQKSMGLEDMETMDKVIAVLELPFTLMRAATIPAVLEEDSDEDDDEEYETAGEQPAGAWDKTLTRLRMIVNPPCTAAFMAWQLDGDGELFGLVLWQACFLLALPASLLMYFLTRQRPVQAVTIVYMLVSFVSGLLWLGVVADELVALLTSFGDILRIPNAILGLTVLAIGNSLGDWAADTAVAKNGFPNMAMSACYGGPLFNLCIGMVGGL